MYSPPSTYPARPGWRQPKPGSPIYLNDDGWPVDREIVLRADGRFDVSHIAFTGVRYALGTYSTWAAAIKATR